MREVKIVVSCIAEVEETWTCRVADDFVVDEDNALDLIEREVPGKFEIMTISDRTTGGETDRTVLDIR